MWYLTVISEAHQLSQQQAARGPVRRNQTERSLVMVTHSFPQFWSNFIIHEDNKADLARFLSERLIKHWSFLPPNCEVHVETGSGFLYEAVAKSTTSFESMPQLAGTHEEVDTQLILNAQNEEIAVHRLIFICRGTDVLFLLMYNVGKQDLEVWMISGTKKNMKCNPIHTMTQNLPEELLPNIIGFNALTGCDTVSSFTQSTVSEWTIA